MRYKVEVNDFTPYEDTTCDVALRRGLTLVQAQRLVTRYIRRGHRLFGGTIDRNMWGGRGGAFPVAYRSAAIRVDA